jgi:hypothetical protein
MGIPSEDILEGQCLAVLIEKSKDLQDKLSSLFPDIGEAIQNAAYLSSMLSNVHQFLGSYASLQRGNLSHEFQTAREVASSIISQAAIMNVVNEASKILEKAKILISSIKEPSQAT